MGFKLVRLCVAAIVAATWPVSAVVAQERITVKGERFQPDPRQCLNAIERGTVIQRTKEGKAEFYVFHSGNLFFIAVGPGGFACIAWKM